MYTSYLFEYLISVNGVIGYNKIGCVVIVYENHWAKVQP